MTEQVDWNKAVIEEFRANEGKVGGNFEGASLLLLHNTGAKSGKQRINPMMYLNIDEQYLVIASKAGADSHPDWYHNIVANPEVTVEMGTERFEAVATIPDEPERTKLYSKMVAVNPGFGDYQKKTSRVIPVILISRK